MAQNDKINPVTLDIVKDSLIAVSNEIFYAFAQTSMSPIIYETLDYASGIADAEGRLLTQGNGVTGFIGMISPMICAVVEKHGKENLHPGDVYIINDPFMGGGTHMSDVGLLLLVTKLIGVISEAWHQDPLRLMQQTFIRKVCVSLVQNWWIAENWWNLYGI